MLGGVVVAELDSLVEVGALDDERVGDTLANDVDARKGESLLLDLLLDGGEAGVVDVDGEEDDLRVGAMLGLTEEIRGDEGGVGDLVGDDLSGKTSAIELWTA